MAQNTNTDGVLNTGSHHMIKVSIYYSSSTNGLVIESQSESQSGEIGPGELVDKECCDSPRGEFPPLRLQIHKGFTQLFYNSLTNPPSFPSTRDPPSAKQRKLLILPVLPRRKENYTPKLMGTLCGFVAVKNGSLTCECIHLIHTQDVETWRGLDNNTTSQSLVSHQSRYSILFLANFFHYIHITCCTMYACDLVV